VAIDYINLHIAKQTMFLRAAHGVASTVSTIWNGLPVLVTWNRMNNAIMFVSCSPGEAIDDEDKGILTNLIKEFYQSLDEKDRLKKNKLTIL